LILILVIPLKWKFRSSTKTTFQKNNSNQLFEEKLSILLFHSTGNILYSIQFIQNNKTQFYGECCQEFYLIARSVD